ncbi:kinase-like domain-containing protein [Aspergillus heterothallicus]
MEAVRTLGSPIEFSLPYRKICEGDKHNRPEKGQTNKVQFIHYEHPFKCVRRFFVSLEPIWNGLNAIEFTEDSPVGFVKKLSVVGNVPENQLSKTCHPNLVNLREVFIATGSVFFVYDKWGMSLHEILRLSPVFQLGEVEVATICKEVLRGLQYIHKVLRISHGSLTLENIQIMEDGSVKIANIGESMMVRPAALERSRDIQAVCRMARTLLGANPKPEIRGTVGLIVSDFLNAPATATVDELLQHSFLKIGAGPWCLRPANILCTLVQRVNISSSSLLSSST